MRHDMQIIRKRAIKRWTGLVALLCLLLSATAEAGIPVISNQRVTDITTRSFSVILTASEPSTAGLSLFAADCTTAKTGFGMTLQQSAASGTMRLTVSGLSAAANYCYQLTVTSASSFESSTTLPVSVTTATAVTRTAQSGTSIVPSGNDILKAPAVHLTTAETRDTIISTVELTDGTAMAPLSLLLTGIPNRDYFNLNNLFSTATGKTLHLAGGERVKISENHGTTGCLIERFRTLPSASGGTAPRSFVQANPVDIDASGGINILDILRVVGGKGTTSTGPCFNSDLDLNNDGIIDSADVTIVKGGFNGLP